MSPKGKPIKDLPDELTDLINNSPDIAKAINIIAKIVLQLEKEDRPQDRKAVLAAIIFISLRKILANALIKSGIKSDEAWKKSKEILANFL